MRNWHSQRQRHKDEYTVESIRYSNRHVLRYDDERIGTKIAVENKIIICLFKSCSSLNVNIVLNWNCNERERESAERSVKPNWKEFIKLCEALARRQRQRRWLQFHLIISKVIVKCLCRLCADAHTQAQKASRARSAPNEENQKQTLHPPIHTYLGIYTYIIQGAKRP